MKTPLVSLAAVLLAGSPLLAQSSQDGALPYYVETPGVTEFTGRLTVRPLQLDALIEQGYDRATAVAIHEAASLRLQPWLHEFVADTDEYILQIPAEFDENSLTAHLLAFGEYEYAEPDWFCYLTNQTPDDPAFGNQWQHGKMLSTQAWEFGFGDGTFIACTVDTGVDLDHPDLEDALISGYNSVNRKSQANGGNVNDLNGHGTATIGCVGAIGNNGVGVVGMAWDIKLMPVRTSNSSGGGASMGDITNGVRWASDNGARSVSASYSGVNSSTVGTTGTHVRNEGTLLCWSSGNGGNRISGFDHANVTVVSASNSSDNVTSWSTYGPLVDVTAPGEAVRTTSLGGGNAAVSGTSFSAPIVNGVFAMMMIMNPSATAGEIEQLMFDNCVDIGNAGQDEKSGWGRPNFFQCLKEASKAEHGWTNTIELTGPTSANVGNTVTYNWTGGQSSATWNFYYSFNPYGSQQANRHLNIGTPRVSVGSGTNSVAGAGSFSKKLPNAAAGRRVYLEVTDSDAGWITDSNMLILDIN